VKAVEMVTEVPVVIILHSIETVPKTVEEIEAEVEKIFNETEIQVIIAILRDIFLIEIDRITL
jgi:hypothetical protein